MPFKPRALAACALIAAFAAPAYATNIALTTNAAQIGYGEWQEFNVSDTDALDYGVEWIDFANSNSASFGTPLAFTFTIAAGEVGSFTVVDGAFAGDTFKLTNFGSDIGTTSAVAPTLSSTAPDTGNNFDAALATTQCEDSSRTAMFPGQRCPEFLNRTPISAISAISKLSTVFVDNLVGNLLQCLERGAARDGVQQQIPCGVRRCRCGTAPFTDRGSSGC